MNQRVIRAKLRKKSELRQQIIREAKNKMDGRVSSAERELFNLAIESIVSTLDFKDGRIVSNATNMGRVNNIRFLDLFYGDKGSGKRFVDWVFHRLMEVQTATLQYFRIIKSPKFPTVSEQAQKVMYKRIGYDPKKKIYTPGGYFDNLITDKTVERKLKSLLSGAVQSNMDFKEIKARSKNLIVSGEKLGVLKKQYIDTGVYDVVAEHDRVINNRIGVGLGLKHFIYNGPILETTRDWCRDKVGNVFSESESLLWENETWQGKNPNCPVSQCNGGYRCTHIRDYISLELAKLLRPDVPEE